MAQIQMEFGASDESMAERSKEISSGAQLRMSLPGKSQGAALLQRKMKEEAHGTKSILLVSCYELGHQPLGIAMPLGFLQRAGYAAETMDVSVEGFDAERIKNARFIGISVPMHTALRLGTRVARESRRLNPDCHICFYGLYALLNAEYLLRTVADSVIGGEFEAALTQLIKAVDSRTEISVDGIVTRTGLLKPVLERLSFAPPDRSSLVPIEQYARLEHNGEERLAGYVEASRGCLHHCTHCPIPPVYGGRFFILPREIVLDDIRSLVASGARHITFGDPDFLNGPGHSLRITRAMHAEFPDLTFDFTSKIEHLLKHRELIPEFAESGCVFVVSAVESLSDAVLERLEKGHTRDDVVEALKTLHRAGIAMRPTFVPFSPWATIDDYIDILEFVESEGLIDHVDPVQYSIRLLVPPGSLLLSRDDTNEWLGRLNEDAFSYEWKHADVRMDELHGEVSTLVERAMTEDQDWADTFCTIRELAYAIRGDGLPSKIKIAFEPLRLRPPRLTEAWFC